MKTMVVVLALVLSSLSLTGQSQQLPQQTSIYAQRFMMIVSTNGKEQKDWFERWEIDLWDIPKKSGGPPPTCQIRVAAFVTTRDETSVDLWTHTARRIVEIEPGTFRIEMDGRLNVGLDVVLKLNNERNRIVEMAGSMRLERPDQLITTFRIDRNSETRKLLPIRNPSLLP